ncbi:MAG: Ca-activated chloride channel family protein, partial [Gammaproteobacteria bacterium]
RADQALIQAYALFENTGLVRGDMLLVSDGLNDRESEAMQKLLKANPGFRLSILGVGSEAGGPIPLAEGGFLKDAQGSIIIARLAARPMQMLTRLGGGSFQMLSANDNDVNGLLKAIERSPFEQDVIASDRSADVWYEQGPWLVLLLLPIVALAFRRGVLLFGPLIIASILLSVTPDAHAFDWDSLWRNSNQRGQLQFEQGDHARAAELFDNPDWKASALYRAGEYDTALQQWQGNDAENANYNRGNALAKLGQLEEAIKAYDQVLQKNPQHADAIYNRKLVEDALKQQQQDPSQNDESGDKNSAEKQSSESEQGEQVDQSQQEQSDQEQQSKQSDQQQQQEEAQSQDQQTEQAKPEATESDPDMSEASLEQKLSEQAAEQWLRKIPDDPGGLLRRKFLYQYKNRGEPQSELNPW